MERFRDCLADCGLADLGFSGYPFTWDNRRAGVDNIQVRLDRATCNMGFSEAFPATTVEHIETAETDHLGLLIRVAEVFPAQHAPFDRGFRFEEMWTRHDEFNPMLENAWEGEDWGDRGL